MNGIMPYVPGHHLPMGFVPVVETSPPCCVEDSNCEEMVLDLSTRKSDPLTYPSVCSPSSSEGASVDFNDNCTPKSSGSARKALSTDAYLTQCVQDKDYTVFREYMLSAQRLDQGASSGTNLNMRRQQNRNSQHANDPNYIEKRRKNNEAAKRSRDARKAKEVEIVIRCKYLEEANMHLKARNAALEEENERLRKIIFHRQGFH